MTWGNGFGQGRGGRRGAPLALVLAALVGLPAGVAVAAEPSPRGPDPAAERGAGIDPSLREVSERLGQGPIPSSPVARVDPADPSADRFADRFVDPAAAANHQRDDKPSPLSQAKRQLRREALRAHLAGDAQVTTNARGRQVTRVAAGKYVEHEVDRRAAIFTVLAEFGDRRLDVTGGTPGPSHNQIPKPDRARDNSTIWRPDFDRAYYLDLLFGPGESFRDFYLKQSGGRFETHGDVSDWVRVPFNAARYGHNPVEGDGTSQADGYWNFVKDAVDAWYEGRRAAGRTPEQIRGELASYDVWDRYDHDGDGDFDEPDGYLDHFQAVFAGPGEEAGGGALGPDALWSHRWYAFVDDAGLTGPPDAPLGGVPIGETGLWVGDYTIEPENGGLGVFTHEFGHDLDLPDLYDTEPGGDNGTGFWTLMSGGSWMNDGTVDIGSKPTYLGPWEKLFLGWTSLELVPYGQDRRMWLGQADREQRGRPQTVVIGLPERDTETRFNTPHSGRMEWWSGSGDDLDNSLSREVDLTSLRESEPAEVSAWVWLRTEEGYDQLLAEVAPLDDAGRPGEWIPVGDPLDGISEWRRHAWDLRPYAGQRVAFRFRYVTDTGISLPGAFLDDLTVTVGDRVETDDVELPESAWTPAGFTRIDGSHIERVGSYYFLENRVYSGYDRYLRTGPYNFGWLTTKPDLVERWPYQDGLLVWYSDGACRDNNTSVHPGCGQSLVVDARPDTMRFGDGFALANRRQAWDATFGPDTTDPVTLHRAGVPLTLPRRVALRTFDDSDPNRYWRADNPKHSSQVAGSGTRVTVRGESDQGRQLLLDIRFRR